MMAEQCTYEYPHVRHKWWHPEGGYRACGGVAIDPATRHYRPASRRLIADELRRIKTYVGHMIYEWTPDSLVRDDRGHYERPRRIEEYPENSAKSWRELERYCKAMSSMMHALAVEARHAAETIEEKQAQ